MFSKMEASTLFFNRSAPVAYLYENVSRIRREFAAHESDSNRRMVETLILRRSDPRDQLVEMQS